MNRNHSSSARSLVLLAVATLVGCTPDGPSNEKNLLAPDFARPASDLAHSESGPAAVEYTDEEWEEIEANASIPDPWTLAFAGSQQLFGIASYIEADMAVGFPAWLSHDVTYTVTVDDQTSTSSLRHVSWSEWIWPIMTHTTNIPVPQLDCAEIQSVGEISATTVHEAEWLRDLGPIPLRLGRTATTSDQDECTIVPSEEEPGGGGGGGGWEEEEEICILCLEIDWYLDGEYIGTTIECGELEYCPDPWDVT